ncbi:MAG: hypothetical protein WAN18_08830, partial [Candidatus Sulfotelmatobacter sp.]
MNMVRHHDGNTQIVFRSVVVQTGFQHERAHLHRKKPPPISAESHKMLMVINLKMRKLPTVEGLRHKVYVGTAALG